MSSVTIKDLDALASKTLKIVVEGKDLVGEDAINNYQKAYDDFKKNAKAVMEPDRTMRLGIVGQVKAGKSSFLNALLFEGRDILPKAATPMTANLTKICYAEEPYAKVHYYSEEAWRGIKDLSQKYDKAYQEEYEKLKSSIKNERKLHREIIEKIDEDWKACKELTEKAKALSPAELSEKLREGEKTIRLEELAEYVGSQGRLAPIVEWTEMGVNTQSLKDVEIYDTPGLGDPVRSRGKKTEDFLKKCDAVIVLSMASQFMGEADVNLILDKLPNEGIRRMSFVASKFDSAMLDDSGRGKSNLEEVFEKTYYVIKGSLEKSLGKPIAQGNKRKEAIFDKVKEEASDHDYLYTISSLLYGVAQKQKKNLPLSAEEKIIIERMQERFSGMSTEPDFLEDLAGIDDFKKEFELIRADKEKIIQERQADYLNKQSLKLLKELDNIYTKATRRLAGLKNKDIAAIKEQLELVHELITKQRNKIKVIFEEEEFEIRSRYTALADEIKRMKKNYQLFPVKNVQTGSYTTGHFFWKKEHITNEYVAEIVDVENNITNYVDDLTKKIGDNQRHSLDSNSLGNKIKSIVIEGIENTRKLDEDEIIDVVNSRLRKLDLPKYKELDSVNYTNKLTTSYPSSRVYGEEISGLKQKLGRILTEIGSDAAKTLENKDQEITSYLDAESVSFADELEKALSKDLQEQEVLLQNAEQSKSSLEGYSTLLKAEKEKLVDLTD